MSMSPPTTRYRTGDGTKPATSGHTGFQPHVSAGDSPFIALRPTPARVSSLGEGTTSKLDAFINGTGNGKWTHLPRAQTAARLGELMRTPTKLDQAGLNACGPAAALYLFAKRKPDQFSNFVIDLYESGKASFGSVSVSGDGLFHKNPATMNWSGAVPAGLDWMILSSVLRSEGAVLRFGGEPSDDASGITMPGEMQTWLKDGVGYASVTDETNIYFNKSLDHLRGLRPDSTHDIVLLINVGVVMGTPKKSKGKGASNGRQQSIGGAIQRQFPDHWFVLEQPVTDDGTKITATGWTWGQSGYALVGSHDAWDDGYYGAMITTV